MQNIIHNPIQDKKNVLKWSLADIELKEVQSFTLAADNSADFYHFLNRFLFKSEKIKATLQRVQEDFGEFSTTFLHSMAILKKHFDSCKASGELQVAYQQWKKFLSIAYGSFEGSENTYLIHTYLSIFSKMLAFNVLEGGQWMPQLQIEQVITGQYFVSKNIQNFVEDDFFNWVAKTQHLNALNDVFRTIAQQLALYDFDNVQEDILKGVYQELIDLKTRHSLGEYYTPDWLCEKIVQDCALKADSTVLDPSCGSGSFLLAAVRGLKKRFPDLTADALLQQVCGIDIHPLSVQIAKTNLLLAIGKDIQHLKRPVTMQIFLANTLYFFHKKFDFVLGNPPWLTYADVKNVEYQLRLREIAAQYCVMPKKIADFPHLEIAAIFLAYCASNFLRSGGKIAFVLPRAFMSAGHHEQTRNGQAQGFQLSEIWDLADVTPLFRVPSCVLMGYVSGKFSNKIPSTGIQGCTVSGKLKKQNTSLTVAEPLLQFEPTEWFFTELGKRSAFSARKNQIIKKENAYKLDFKQGATIVPRNFYFVDITQTFQGAIHDRILTVKTAADVLPDAKAPWKSILMPLMPICTNFLFYTALAKHILPFGILPPPKVLLPLRKVSEVNHLQLLTHQQLLELGEIETSIWFKQVENHWNTHKTENNATMDSVSYLNWQQKLTDQNLNKRYLVLYTASAKDANAVTVDRQDYDLDFIVESKTYVFFTHNLEEAHYLTCFLNAKTPNERIKDFQSTGLFGARDVHKTILEIPFPKYDSKKDLHQQLATLGAACHAIMKNFMQEKVDLTNYKVGRVRMQVAIYLEMQLKAIDEIVQQLIV